MRAHVRPLMSKDLSAFPEVPLHTGYYWALVTLARSHSQTANPLSNGGNAETSGKMSGILSHRAEYSRMHALNTGYVQIITASVSH